MCKTSLVDQNGDVVSALQTGVVILLIPPLIIMGTIMYRVFYQMPKQLDFPANKLITIVDLFLRNIHDLNLSRAKLANSVK